MSTSPSQSLPKDQQETLLSLFLRCGTVLDTAFRTAVELNLFEIMEKAGPDAELSAAEISSHLPTTNEQAPDIIDRILHLLASHSVVKCTVVSNENGKMARLYGLTPFSKCLLPDEEGISRAPKVAYTNDRAIVDSWKCLKDAILEGGTPFENANNGMNLFQYLGKNHKFSLAFNDAMHSMAANYMRDILESYKGFENLKEIVDIGGGVGITLKMIVSKYPWIKGINFDLPHVIKDAPVWPGVQHVEGDMFESVPKGEAILIKRVLHDWTDEDCVKVLKNCFNALPDSGKVIIIETILPESSEADISSRLALTCNLIVFTVTPGGRERTEREFESLAKAAGFAASRVACRTYELCVLEFYKN